MSNRYHIINSCDETGNIDFLLNQYKEDRDLIAVNVIQNPQYLLENLWTYNSPLAIDRSCNCSLGSKISRTKYCCSQCSNFKKIIDFRKNLADTYFLIEYGGNSGEKLAIIKNKLGNLFIQEDVDTFERYVIFYNLYPMIKLCCNSVPVETCIVGDNFTIKNIITILFQKYYNENGNNFTPYMHTSFVCNNDGYSLYKVPSIGTFNTLITFKEYYYLEQGRKILNSNVSKSILIQLIIILRDMMDYNFSHGEPCVISLLFNREPFKTTIGSLKINSVISLQISNLINSSATFAGNHYFSKTTIDDLNLENIMLSPKIEMKEMKEMKEKNNVKTLKYKLERNNVSMFNTLSGIGFPIFSGSYDFYCFFTSLMCRSEFYNSVIRDKGLKKLWDSLWEKEDLDSLNKNIKLIHEKNYFENYSDVKKLICNKWLTCDILMNSFNFLPEI